MIAGAAILLLALIAIIAVLVAPSADDDVVDVPAPRDGDETDDEATDIAEKERAR